MIEVPKELFADDLRRANKTIARLYKLYSVAKFAASDHSTKEKEKIAAQLINDYEVRVICEALDLDRGTFYNYIYRGLGDNTWYKKRHDQIAPIVKEIYQKSSGTYGADKIRAVLRRRGFKKISREYVRDIMHEYGLRSLHTYSNREKRVLNWDTRKTQEMLSEHHVTAPNVLWTSDITVFRYSPCSKKYYLCAYMDAYSRKIIAYNIGRNASTHLTSKTFIEAYNARKPAAGLVLHTDNGSGYTSRRFEKMLRDRKCTHEYSRPNKPHDNAMIESFFGKFKVGRFGQTYFHSEHGFFEAVKEYINEYNTERPHSAFNNRLTPEEKEREYYKKTHSTKRKTA